MKFTLPLIAFAVATAAAVSSPSSGKIFFEENFASFPGTWVVSNFKPESEIGKWNHTAGEFYADKEDRGIQTGEDARFYGLSSAIQKEFNNKGGDLVLQMSVKHEQGLICGGGYIKLLPRGTNLDDFGGDSPYAVMFGPDICGTKRTHVIFGYDKEHREDSEGSVNERKNVLIAKDVETRSDQLTHLYTLIVKKDNTFEVRIDNKEVESGSLHDKFPFLPSKEIRDPDESKPEDWVDEQKIPDPEAEKPEDWVDEAEIVDPEAEKPEDWDDDDDGEWEAPMIPNPDYKGEWKAPEIDNPEYKGPWEHPMIPNPEYYEDDHLYHVCNPCAAVGFELWQVQAGTIFDNILVTDSVDEAEAAAEKVLKNMEKEKKMWDTNQEEIKKKREEEQKISEFSGLMESSIAAGKEKEEEEEEESNGKDEL